MLKEEELEIQAGEEAVTVAESDSQDIEENNEENGEEKSEMKEERSMPAIAALEAVLFAMGEPLELGRLADAVELSKAETRKLLEELRTRYASEESGIQLLWMEER